MGYHEQLPSENLPSRPGASIEYGPEMVPLREPQNTVQRALMGAWGRSLGLEQSDIGREWVDQGFAKRFSDYADAHPEERLNPEDSEAVEELLEKIAPEAADTVH